MKRKVCLNTYIRGYILPKGKQRMIFMTGYSVENPFRKGKRNFHDITHTTVFG